jgi:hypothetical protein
MKFLPFVIACGVVGFAAQMPTAKTQNPPKVSDAIHQLFVEDGEDASNGISKFSEEQLTARGNARREKVRALLAAGELKTGEDFHEAAFIFQHRNNPEDYLFAHVLAMEAVLKGSDEAKWIEAATLDRYLQSIGAAPSIRDAISPRPKSATSATSSSWFPSGVPFRKNASALQRAVPSGFSATRLLRSSAGAAKGEPGDVQRGQTPDRDDEGAGLPALGTGLSRA